MSIHSIAQDASAGSDNNIFSSGLKHSRRKRSFSDPLLAIGLYTVLALGLLLGLVAFLTATSDALKNEDRAHAEASAQIGALKVDNLLRVYETTLEVLAEPTLAAVKSEDPNEIRQLRRDIAAKISGVSALGMIAVNRNNDVLFSVGTSLGEGGYLQSSSQLYSETEYFEDEFQLIPQTGDILHLSQRVSDDLRMVFVIKRAALDKYLVSGEGQNLSLAALVDFRGRVLSGGQYNENQFVPLREIDADLPRAKNDVIVGWEMYKPAERKYLQAALVSSKYESLAYVFGSRPSSLLRILKEKYAWLLIMFGPGALCMMVYGLMVQNEWNKRDRRINVNDDAIARATIAADILEAGIMEWTVSTSAVTVSRGWVDLYECEKRPEWNDIHSWLNLVHPDHRKSVREKYQSIIDGEVRSLDHTLPVLLQDNSFKLIRERAAVRINEKGDISRVIFVHMAVNSDS